MGGASPHRMRDEVVALEALAERAARAAGDQIRSGRSLALQVHHKSAIDLVTQVDLAAERAIREVLAAATPDVPILAEEGGGSRGDTRWIVDPLDGTTNFVHGFPEYAVSIALQVDGELRAGCIYEPLRDRCFLAGKGRGARCNGVPLRVSTVRTLDAALMLTGFAYDRRQRAAFYLHFVKAFLERSQGIRRAGAASLDFCHIAAGEADGYWEFNLAPWDVAAGALLVVEAGGQVSAMDGGALRIDAPQVLASNGYLHEELLAVMAELSASAPGPSPGSGPVAYAPPMT
jgi:myo-inositol-1(or 4)-monophosphatase